jgi:4-amino-4-deoxy-L-arabinose transferase-like glycosyltransferase
LALYAAIHVGLRLLLSPVVAIDDSREAFFSQTLQRGYLAQQPPLYSWLVWASVQLWGVSTTTLVICRYAILSLLYLFLYLSAAHLLRHGTLAVLAAFSLILVGPFTWDAHTELTQSLAASAAAAATLYALLRVGRSGGTLAYLGLGVATAAGLLAKFSYGLFVGALLVGAMAVPEYRRRVLAPRFGLTIGVVVLLCLPYALWFLGRELSVASLYAEEIRQAPVSYRRGVTRGLFHLGRMLLVYVLPFALVFLAVFRGTLARETAFPGTRRLLAVLLLVEVGVLITGTLTGQLTYFRIRWLMPVFVLVPLFAFTWIDPAAVDRRRIARYVATLLLVETLVVLGLVANVLRGDAFGAPTRLNAPYDVIADTLAATGFARGTIAAGEGPLAGNLRLRFPDSRVIRLSNPDYLPPATGQGQCLIVWEEPGGDHSTLVSWVASVLGARVEAESPQRMSAPYRHARTRSLEVRYILIPAGRGECR